MKQLAVALVVASACMVVQAKEITWTGAVDADFANEGNWSGGAPVSGDTAKFTATATTEGAFDLGSGGLTIDVANGATLTCHTSFGGVGRLTKTGTGNIRFDIQGSQKNVGSFTGGLRMISGKLIAGRPSGASEWSLYIGATENVVELVLTGDEMTDPSVQLSGWSAALSSPVHVTGVGASGWETFATGDAATVGGSIEAETDVFFNAASGSRTFRLGGNVDMKGHTFTFRCGVNSDIGVVGSGDWWTKRTFAGNLSLYGAHAEIRAQGTDRDGTLNLACPTDLYRSWASTNIILSGATTVLTLKNLITASDGILRDRGSLSTEARVHLLDGAKLNVDTGVEQSLCELSIDGQSVPYGKYTRENLPEAIEGNGSIWIAPFKFWTGGDSGLASEGTNWLDGTPAKAGDLLVFEKNVTLTSESFDFGVTGIGIMVGSGVTVTCQTQFAGSGKLTKYGNGVLKFNLKTNGSFTGGLRMESGTLNMTKPSDAWATYVGGSTCVIEMVMSGNDETDPRITYGNWAAGLNNEIRVLGTNADGHDTVMTSDQSSLNGNIVSETDFRYRTGSTERTFTIGGNIDIGENVFYVCGKCIAVELGAAAKTFAGGLTAEQSPGVVKFKSKGTDIDGALTALAPIELYNSWAGTNIVIRGENAKLSIQPAASLVREAVVAVADGGKLDVSDGTFVKIAKLTVDGHPVPDGTYTKDSLPDAISGEGRVRVGRLGLFVILR